MGTREPDCGSVLAWIRARHSVRRYDGRPLEAGDRAALEALCAGPQRGPLGGEARFRLLDFSPEGGDELRTLGTYGSIRGTRAFVAGAVRRSERDLEDYGFLLERIVLSAVGRGLGTCWLGGFFNRSGFARVLGLEAGESLPAVTPVGRPARREGLIDRVFHLSTASHTRRPWEILFFDGRAGVPLTPEAAGPWREPLEMVRLAPSTVNRQPWRVVREGTGAFHFYRAGPAVAGGAAAPSAVPGSAEALRAELRETRSVSYRPAVHDLQRVDLGIALCHFDLAAAELGLAGSWRSAEAGRAAADSRAPALPVPAGWAFTATWEARP